MVQQGDDPGVQPEGAYLRWAQRTKSATEGSDEKQSETDASARDLEEREDREDRWGKMEGRKEKEEIKKKLDVQLVLQAGSLEQNVQQLQSMGAQISNSNQIELSQLNESSTALRKTALAVPRVQVDQLDSEILNGEAEDLQRMLGDDMNLVSCERARGTRGTPLRGRR